MCFRLARESSSTDCRAASADLNPSTTDCVCERRSRSSAARASWEVLPRSSRPRSSATSLACPSARRTRFQTRTATPPVAARTHTRRSANNSSSADIWWIVARNMGRNKGINMSAVAEIKPLPEPSQTPDRIPLEEVYMRMAEELAKRSTCARLQVGSVITSGDMTQVLGIGYNGNARGLPNRCDSAEAGKCGCVHGELNSLVKAGAQVPNKVMFVTASPCVMCAKSIINCNVARVYYREAYRDPAGLDTLRQGGVEVLHYDRWRDLWR
ncbi:MAG: hypothetical protein E6I69_05515 [Chloroflexi bacterium]|nr:MAG: hypothetical protein E6I69_05515 [Chloroflexota bacterium]